MTSFATVSGIVQNPTFLFASDLFDFNFMNYYEEPIYEEPRTRVALDPGVIPIRSCLRSEDELQS